MGRFLVDDLSLTEEEVQGMYEHLKKARISEFESNGAAVGFFKLFQVIEGYIQLEEDQC